MSIDPVCGMKVDESCATFVERGGRKFHFCSDTCRQKFLLAPEGKFSLRWRRFKRLRAKGALIYARLHPRAGRKLPKELRAEQVGSLAEELPWGVRDDGFEKLVGRIETDTIHNGNQVQLFFRGEEALASVIQDVEGAKDEILLETYILKDDETGRKLLGVLGTAAARGVKVLVLADAYGSWNTKRKFWNNMQGAGIEVRLFHPFWSGFRNILFRDHRKIIVVDRLISYTGGMNVANEYGYLRRKKGRSFRDTHIRVEGPAAWEMALVFSEGWGRSGATSLHLPPLVRTDNDGVRTLVLDSRSGRGHGEMASVLAALVAASRKRLWISNSYFAPNKTAIRLLAHAARRGVDVRLLLQGPSDSPLVRHAGHGNYSELLENGVRIFEYQTAVLHAKTIVADDYISVVGSSNLDFRSYYFNAECNVLLFDDATGQRMAQAFLEDLEHSTEIRVDAWKKRSFLHRCLDAVAHCLSPLL
ncbi:MAG: phospholipase D-like domain-containing protein [Victivallales bacterium]|jgi:cardiolipin synthase